MRKILLKNRFEIAIFFIYLLVAIVVTFPLITHLASSLYGYTSDNFSGAWYFWWLKYASINHLKPDFTSIVGAPFGTTYGTLTLEDLWFQPARLLTLLFNQFVALNFLFLFSFPLTGMGMYFLTKYLIKDKLASFWAGLILIFAPYHFWQGYAHLSLSLIYPLPFYILALLYFDRHKSKLAAFLLAIAFQFVFLTNFYYGIFMIISTGCFFVIKGLLNIRKGKEYFLSYVKPVLLFGVLVTIFSLPYLFKYLMSNYGPAVQAVSAIPTRSVNDFLSLSLRPWDLFLPAPDNPFLGNLSQSIYKFIFHLGSDYKTTSAFLPERVVYIGMTTFFFWLLSLYLYWKKKIKSEYFILLFILTTVIFLFSFPPFIAFRGHNFYLPSFLIFKVVPQLRVLVRLGIVILLLMVLISSFSVSYIMKKLTYSKKLIFITVISLVALLELVPFPSIKITEFDNPPAYYTFVKQLPKDTIIAEYPWRFDIADALIWQTYHGKKLFNMFQGEYYQLWDQVRQLGKEQDTDLLSSLGVRYVIYHTAYLYKTPHPFDELYFTRFEPSPTIVTLQDGSKTDVKEFSWLKLVKEYDGALLYEVVPTNSKFVSYDLSLPNKISWMGDNSLQLTRKNNEIYFFNFSKETKKFSLSYILLGSSGQIIGQSFNDAIVPELNSQDFTLQPGLNTIQVKVENDNSNLVYSHIQIKLSGADKEN